MANRPEQLNIPALLESAGIMRTLVHYRRGDAIYTQGDPCEHVWYIESGDVKLSVVSRVGKEGVVALLGPGDFLGEAGLAGQPSQPNSATAIMPGKTMGTTTPMSVRHLLAPRSWAASS